MMMMIHNLKIVIRLQQGRAEWNSESQEETPRGQSSVNSIIYFVVIGLH